MFADSFSVVSIHCIAGGLAASFLYKCPTPHCTVVACDSTAFLFSIKLQSSHLLFGTGLSPTRLYFSALHSTV